MLPASELLTPKGRLNAAALWPTTPLDEVTEFINAYLTEGYAKAGAGEDEAATQWAYYRAWDEVYQRLVTMPSSVSSAEEGSASYTDSQIQRIGDLAADALAAFEGLVGDAGDLSQYAVITSLR